MKRICVLCVAALCLLTNGWGQRRAVSNREAAVANRAAAAAAPKRSDAELEKDIRARFARSKINANHFAVRVQGGVATIEGRTDVVQHKGTATRMAKNAGAARVDNRIEVSQAARDRANANLAKGRRRAQVKRGAARSERGGVRQGS